MKTKVIFRTFRKGGDVIAYFPEIPADRCPSHCMSYAHCGQHGAALAYWSGTTRPATPAEVRPPPNQNHPMKATHYTRLSCLNGLRRPDDGATLLDCGGNHLGRFDFSWSSDLLFRCESGDILRSDSWVGLLSQITWRFGCE